MELTLRRSRWLQLSLIILASSANPALSSEEDSQSQDVPTASSVDFTTTDNDQVDNSMEGLVTAVNKTGNDTTAKLECDPIPLDEQTSQVKIVNSTQLHDLLDATVTNSSRRCSIVLFYYPWCIFSSKAAPHFNALGRLFPQIHVLALDAYASNGINMRFGLVGVPSILFFHNSKFVGKFNDSSPTIERLVSFVHHLTGFNAKSTSLELTEEDLQGPVPTTVESRLDFVLITSWIFILGCCAHFFIQSSYFKRIAEYIRNNWREAEQANHEHAE